MNTFEILFLTACSVVTLAGIAAAIKARKVMGAFKKSHSAYDIIGARMTRILLDLHGFMFV